MIKYHDCIFEFTILNCQELNVKQAKNSGTISRTWAYNSLVQQLCVIDSIRLWLLGIAKKNCDSPATSGGNGKLRHLQ